jgi:hypothetical protein
MIAKIQKQPTYHQCMTDKENVGCVRNGLLFSLIEGNSVIWGREESQENSAK